MQLSQLLAENIEVDHETLRLKLDAFQKYRNNKGMSPSWRPETP